MLKIYDKTQKISKILIIQNESLMYQIFKVKSEYIKVKRKIDGKINLYPSFINCNL